MLNRENRAVLKALHGDYKKFAKRLASSAFARCEGNQAINENLAEMFSLLKNAQEQDKPFEKTIPEPETTIRETLLCFPPKQTWRIALVWAFTALFIICAAIGSVLLYLKLAKQTEDPKHTLGEIRYVNYYAESSMIEWQQLNYVKYYKVYAIDPETEEMWYLGQKSSNILHLEAIDRYHIGDFFDKAFAAKRNSIDIKIFAKSERENFCDYETQIPMYFEIPTIEGYTNHYITYGDYSYADGWEKFVSVRWLPYLTGMWMHYGQIKLTTYDYNFYGRIDNPENILYIRSDSHPYYADNVSEELDPTQEHLFLADYQYTFFFKIPASYEVELDISIADIRNYVGKLPSGKTLFAIPDDNKPVALASGNQSIGLSILDMYESGICQPYTSYRTTFPIELSSYSISWGGYMRQFYVAENQSDKDQAFYITDDVIDFQVENFQKTITLEPGYTTLRVNLRNDARWESKEKLTYYFSVTSKKNVEYYSDNPDDYLGGIKAGSRGRISPTEGLNGGMLKEWNAAVRTGEFLVTLYVREETEITVEGKEYGTLDTDNAITLDGAENVYLKPGYTKVELVYEYTLVVGIKQFEIGVGALPWTNGIDSGYIVKSVGATVTYIFNPNDYGIEIIANEIDFTVISHQEEKPPQTDQDQKPDTYSSLYIAIK